MKHFLQCFLGVVVCLSAVGLSGSVETAEAQAEAQSANKVQPGSDLATDARAKSPAARVTVESASNPKDPSTLMIGSGDEVEVTVYGAPDLSGHTRVGSDGNISLPLVGHIRIAGLTSDEAQEAISEQLQGRNIVKNPQVSVYVKEYTNSEISVAGEVVKPGVFSALGPHRLLDVLEAAGGLTDKASNTITISHLGTNQVTTLHLPNDAAEMAKNNIDLKPGDTVLVPKAEIVYVLGEVNKPGGYALNSSGGLTVLQVVSAAGGPTRLAAISGTKMVRRTSTGLKEIPVPLKDLLRAKLDDIPVQAGDVLYIPSSHLKSAINAGALVTSAGTAAIYRVP
jgi:polysaccharide biosynthesis/export protein